MIIIKRSKLLSIVTEGIYLLNVIAAVIFSICLNAEINEAKMQNTEGTESIGIALGVAILAVLLIFALIYVVYSLLPLLFKTVGIFVPKIAFPIICMVFDTVSFIAATILFISVIVGEGTVGGLIIFLIPSLLFAAAFVLNLLTCKAIGKENIEATPEADTEEITA